MDTKKGADTLNNFLNNANYNAIAIHGDKSQPKRLVIYFNNFQGSNRKIYKWRSSYTHCY